MAEDSVDINLVIERILWGKSIAEVEGSDGIPHLFILRSLTIKETNLVQYIYKKELDVSLRAGLLSQKELEELFRSQEMWTDRDDKRIVELDVHIKQLKKQIKAAEFMLHRKKLLEKQLAQEIGEQNELSNRKNSLYNNSAESRAEEIKRRFVVMMSTETREEKPYWESREDFLEETDHTLIYNLAIAYYQNNIFDEKTLRKVARSGTWRFRWKAGKSGADLFGKPICDWSEMQNMLVYWSQLYDYVYESLDSPAEFIIDNDVLCDAWIDEQSKKHVNKGNDKENILGTKKAKVEKAHQEEFIMVDPKDTASIKEIQEMNAPTVRKRLKEEYDRIKKSNKRVSEWDLRKGRLPNGDKII